MLVEQPCVSMGLQHIFHDVIGDSNVGTMCILNAVHIFGELVPCFYINQTASYLKTSKSCSSVKFADSGRSMMT